jgi:hypothetical protein
MWVSSDGINAGKVQPVARVALRFMNDGRSKEGAFVLEPFYRCEVWTCRRKWGVGPKEWAWRPVSRLRHERVGNVVIDMVMRFGNSPTCAHTQGQGITEMAQSLQRENKFLDLNVHQVGDTLVYAQLNFVV